MFGSGSRVSFVIAIMSSDVLLEEIEVDICLYSWSEFDLIFR